VTDGSPPKPAYPIESVDNALKLLLIFGEGKPVRVAEASETIGVARSTAHRLLAMLQYHRFVHQDPETRAYEAGPALMAAGLKVIHKIDIRRRARPHLETLSQATGETVHLAMRQNSDVIFLDAVESPKAVRVASRIGALMPAHCTSVGKALLAQLDDDELLALYPSEDLPKLTARSIGSRAALLKQLNEVRENGYATSGGEAEESVGSVGLAIPKLVGGPAAAISISAPTDRLNSNSEALFVKHARATIAAIADSVGGEPSSGRG
jgi:DNA-binding IclR family transcriptional regulator